MPKECEACGLRGADDYIQVRTTNGGLVLCRQCLDDINRKNPMAEIYKSALEHILGWDCLTPEPLVDLCADLGWLKRLVTDALAGKKSW